MFKRSIFLFASLQFWNQEEKLFMDTLIDRLDGWELAVKTEIANLAFALIKIKCDVLVSKDQNRLIVGVSDSGTVSKPYKFRIYSKPPENFGIVTPIAIFDTTKYRPSKMFCTSVLPVLQRHFEDHDVLAYSIRLKDEKVDKRTDFNPKDFQPFDYKTFFSST